MPTVMLSASFFSRFALPEVNIGGFYIPWIAWVLLFGLLLGWAVMDGIERFELSRHIWHPPLFFLAMAVIFGSLFGLIFFP